MSILNWIWVYIAVGAVVIMFLDITDEINLSESHFKKLIAILIWPVIVVVCIIMKDWRLW